MNDLVSVIIPLYNRQNTIVRAIESVLNQTYKNIEIIIVDDCSNDDGCKIIEEKYKFIDKVHLIRLKKNSGACVARNVGIDAAKGKYISFLDSDDEYLPLKIELQINKLMLSNSDICVSSYQRVNKDGLTQNFIINDDIMNPLYYNLLYCNFITTGVLFGKKECFAKNKFDERLPRYQDWDLVLRLCKKYVFTYVEQFTLLQEHQNISITSRTSHEKTLYSLKLILEKHRSDYSENKKAYQQINWLIGLHSMYTDKKDFKSLWSGVIIYKFKLKRFLIFLVYKMRINNLVKLNI